MIFRKEQEITEKVIRKSVKIKEGQDFLDVLGDAEKNGEKSSVKSKELNKLLRGCKDK